MRHHAGGTVRAIEDDVVATEKDGTVTLTLINRSYDKETSFTMPQAGTVRQATLLSGEGILPWSRFNESAIPITEEDGRYAVTLPAHSIAVIRLER